MLSLPIAARGGARFRILCIGAHCDDIEIGCGGTMLKLLECVPQSEVYWVVLSADSVRAREATDSAQAFLDGATAKTIVIKEFRNSFFPFIGATLKEYFETLKATVAPDVIFTHRREDLHQDHQLVSQLTWNTFRNHMILEYEIPKYDGDLGSPSVFTHLSEHVCHRKVAALMAHFKSQLDKPWFDEQTFWALLRLRGMESNSPSKYAEAFYCRKVVLG